MAQNFSLHQLGWQAFQDLCVAIVEEQVTQSVQTFLPTNDAGRDGAFRGTWDSNYLGQSTIQCKFTSKPDERLSLSMLTDELPKAERLARMGLADEYIIITNHTITGSSELRIKKEFESVGVGCCRVFHRDWVLNKIRNSPRLRMMMPRLYGIVDLSMVLDERAYRQAQLVLSQMGESLQKLVVTDAHRKSVRAISEHNLVLLLGSPATGKSTIGASLALGASDTWNALTIKSTSPEHLEKHLDPNGGQFFWIDDAWGSTQYQSDRTEKWNQVFPLMQGAMRHGTRFLITSRDYIWAQAKLDLKLHALPVLQKSQVIIDVRELSTNERARILYNHLKLGDQNARFRKAVKGFLPEISKLKAFLPESARRLGNSIFTDELVLKIENVKDFFNNPKEFLGQIINNLSPECRAAISLVFSNGGVLRSPVAINDFEASTIAFGVRAAEIRLSLESLNGSLLNLAQDEDGSYWTYHHPTVSDAFALYLSTSPELIEIYLNGAKVEFLASEVVCAGINIKGAKVIVPTVMHEILAGRLKGLPEHKLKNFLSYRSNKKFTKVMLRVRPDLLERVPIFLVPLKEDSDAYFFSIIHSQGQLPEGLRVSLVDELRNALINKADDSFIDNLLISSVLTKSEKEEFFEIARNKVLENISEYINEKKVEWDSDYDPENYFDEIKYSLVNLVKNVFNPEEVLGKIIKINIEVDMGIRDLNKEYQPSIYSDAPTTQRSIEIDSLDELFRDVDL